MATVDPSTALQLISLQLRHNRVRNRLQATRRRMQSRRKAVFFLCTTSVLLLCADLLIPNPRSVWMHTRSTRWWEDVLGHFVPHDWMENFRMSRETFQYLCDQLRPLVQKQNTRMRRPVSTEHRVAITLWVLATPAEYRSVAHLFGLARCTVCKIVNETCRAIVLKLPSPSLHSIPIWRWVNRCRAGIQGEIRYSTVCWFHRWITCANNTTCYELYRLL